MKQLLWAAIFLLFLVVIATAVYLFSSLMVNNPCEWAHRPWWVYWCNLG